MFALWKWVDKRIFGGEGQDRRLKLKSHQILRIIGRFTFVLSIFRNFRDLLYLQLDRLVDGQQTGTNQDI